MELGSDINMAKDNGVAPRVIAAENGHEVIVQILRDAGAV